MRLGRAGGKGWQGLRALCGSSLSTWEMPDISFTSPWPSTGVFFFVFAVLVKFPPREQERKSGEDAKRYRSEEEEGEEEKRCKGKSFKRKKMVGAFVDVCFGVLVVNKSF